MKYVSTHTPENHEKGITATVNFLKLDFYFRLVGKYTTLNHVFTLYGAPFGVHFRRKFIKTILVVNFLNVGPFLAIEN